MERIDAANAAEIMLRRERMELIEPQRVVAAQQVEPAFVHFDHQRILAPADRTVARRELGEVGIDLEGDCAAVATAAICLDRPSAHCETGRSRSPAPRAKLFFP